MSDQHDNISTARRMSRLRDYLASEESYFDAIDSNDRRQNRVVYALILLIRKGAAYPDGLAQALRTACIGWSWLRGSKRLAIIRSLVELLESGSCERNSRLLISYFFHEVSKPENRSLIVVE